MANTPALTERYRRARSGLIAELAKEIRRVYCQARDNWHLTYAGKDPGPFRPYQPGPTWDGGKIYRNGHVTTPAWPKLAKFFVENQITDYAAFILAQFEVRKGRGFPPTPVQCTGQAALRVWRERFSGELEDVNTLRAMFISEQECCRAELFKLNRAVRGMERKWSQAQLYASVLFNEMLSLSPLFRVCLGSAMGLKDVVQHYHRPGLFQYCLNPGNYDAVYGRWIPRVLQEEAAGLREALRNSVQGT